MSDTRCPGLSRTDLENEVLRRFQVNRESQQAIADKLGIPKTRVQRICAEDKATQPIRNCQWLDRYWRIPQWRPDEEKAA